MSFAPVVGGTRRSSIIVTLGLALIVLGLVAVPAHSSWSGGNGRIVQVGHLTGATGSRIFSRNADGSGLVALTADDGATYAHPRYSSDGSRIAYTRDANVWTMNADGAFPHQITTGGDDHEPVWSKDSATIFFSTTGHSTDSRLYKVPAGGGAETAAIGSGIADTAPAVSSDGAKLAFRTIDGGTPGDILSVAVANGGCGCTQLTSTGEDEDHPNWAPGGGEVVYDSNPGANRDVFAISSASGGTRRPLAATAATETNPVFSPDGAKIAYQSGTDIVIMDASDGGNKTAVTSAGVTSASEPDWAPGAPATNKRPSGTQVMCTFHALTATDTCTATVGDGGPPPGANPTGTVTFVSRKGGFFSFGNTCLLKATANTPSVSSCSVEFVPASKTFPSIVATYSGSATQDASAASTDFIILRPATTTEEALVCSAPGQSHSAQNIGPPAPVKTKPPPSKAIDVQKCANMAYAAGFAGQLTDDATTQAVGVAALGLTALVPVPSQPLTAALTAGSGLGVATSFWVANQYSKMAHEPPDRRFRTLPRVKPKHQAKVRVKGLLGRRLNSLLSQEALAAALGRASAAGIDKAGGAAKAHNGTWERKQMLAVAKNSTRLAKTLRRIVATRRSIAAKLSRRSMLDLAAVQKAEKRIAAKGLPAAVARALRGAGMSASAVRILAARAARVDPARVAGPLSGFVANKTTLRSYGDAAKGLSAFASRVRRKPKVTTS